MAKRPWHYAMIVMLYFVMNQVKRFQDTDTGLNNSMGPIARIAQNDRRATVSVGRSWYA